MLIVTGLTMLLTPALAHTARRLGAWMEERAAHEVVDLLPVPDIENHVVLAGFGRVGRMIASVLDREGIPYLAIDHNPITAERAGAEGRPVRFGDASRLEVLRAAHVEYASALVITIGSEEATEELTKRMRQAAPQVPLYTRARNSVHAERLMSLGATGPYPRRSKAACSSLGAYSAATAWRMKRCSGGYNSNGVQSSSFEHAIQAA